MRAEKVGSDTVLAQIVQLVAQAQRSRAPMQRMADTRRFWFVLAVLRRCDRDVPGCGASSARSPSWTYAVRQRGRGADHRLPVRARACDADVDHGRDRPRRAGGRAVPRRRGDRALAHDRHADRRQDRHADRRAGPRFATRSRSTAFAAGRGAAPRGQPGPGQRTSARRGDRRRGAATRTDAVASREDFESATGIGVRGRVDGQRAGARQHGADAARSAPTSRSMRRGRGAPAPRRARA